MGNLGVAVNSALQRANEEAERTRATQEAAKREYIRRRKLSTPQLDTGIAGAEPRYEVLRDEVLRDEVALPLKRRSTHSSLLLRMAQLRKQDVSPSGLDEAAIVRYFPEWVSEDGALKSDPVLKDVIVALSLLSHDSFTRER